MRVKGVTDVKVKAPKGEENGHVPDNSPVSWSEFTQDTTCHGVRFIFTKGAEVWRRALWAAIVLFSLTFFISQVTTRTLDYLKYETTTAIDVEYHKSLPFPAVTICNQNSIRISKAREMDFYQFANLYFEEGLKSIQRGSKNWTTDNGLPEHLQTVNSRTFLKAVDHNLTDMIERCEWQGVKCNMTQQIQATISKSGVCFTFNHENINLITKQIDHDKLQMALNVETYEHMKGVNDDSGIRIFIHNQADRAFPPSKGITLSPGKYARIGISREDALQLAPPYGICSTDAKQSVEMCSIACMSKIQSDQCGCLVPFDIIFKDEQDNKKVCNTTKLFDCVLPEHNGMTGLRAECTCDIPCKTTNYQYHISQSDLSYFNVKNVILKDDISGKRSEYLRHKFYTAQESRQRMDTQLSSSNEKRDKAFLKSNDELKEAILNGSGRLMASTLHLNIAKLRDGLKEDRKLLNSTLMNMWFSFAKEVVEATTALTQAQEIKATFDNFTDIRLNTLTSTSTSLEEEFRNHCANDTKEDLTYPNNIRSLFEIQDNNQESTESNADKAGCGNDESFARVSSDTQDDSSTDASSMESLSSIVSWMEDSTSGESHRRRKRSLSKFVNITTTTSAPTPGHQIISKSNVTNVTVTRMPDKDSDLISNFMNNMNITATFAPLPSPTPLISKANISNENDTKMHNKDFDRISTCQHFMNELDKHLLPENVFDASATLSNMLKSYNSMVETYIAESALDKIPELEKCQNDMEVVQNAWLNYFSPIEYLKKNFTDYSNKDFVMEFSIAMDQMKNMQTPATKLYSSLRFNCFWLPNYINTNTMEHMLKMLSTAEDLLYAVNGIRSELNKKMIAFDMDYLEKSPVSDLINVTRDHMSGRIDKLTQTEAFVKDESRRNLDTMQEKSDEYRRLTDQFESAYDQVLYNIRSVLDDLDSNSIPILPENTQIMLAWTQMSTRNCSNMTCTENNIYKNKVLKEIISEVMQEKLGVEKEKSIYPVKDGMKEFLVSAKALEEESASYYQACAFDEQHFMRNFLIVDIFYEELKTTVVTQKEAFGLTSLLGEVGGFLGLLLGASILTLFELLDFVFMKSKSAVKTKRDIKPIPS